MIKIALLTISDSISKGLGFDSNRNVVESMIKSIDGQIVHYEVIPDEIEIIQQKLIYCCDELNTEIIFTNGGTGFSKRDVTPEATTQVIEKVIPGIPEAMRFAGFSKTKRAALSRGVAGIRGNTIIINLPGSSKGVEESLEAILEILPHALEMIEGKKH